MMMPTNASCFKKKSLRIRHARIIALRHYLNDMFAHDQHLQCNGLSLARPGIQGAQRRSDVALFGRMMPCNPVLAPVGAALSQRR